MKDKSIKKGHFNFVETDFLIFVLTKIDYNKIDKDYPAWGGLVLDFDHSCPVHYLTHD